MKSPIRNTSVSLLLALSLALSASSQPLETLLQERIDANETPGIVVGVFENEKARYYSYGFADIASQRRVDSKTLFEIGSITKTFTTTALAELAQEGKISLEDPVQKFLPNTVTIPKRNEKVITLIDLATAHSGLPRMPDNMKPADPETPYIDYTDDLLFTFLSGYSLTRDIGSQYEYSNLGMGLLGVVLTRIDGKPYRTVIATRILVPLKMSSTFLNSPDRVDKNVATGYSGKKVAKPWTWTDQSCIQGAGGLRSNAEDMITYLVANLKPGDTPLGRAMASSHRTRADAGRNNMKIGLGWHIRNNIVWHNGGTGGFRTFAGFDPTKRMAVVVLTNSTTGADDLGFHLLDETIPLKKIRRPISVDAAILNTYTGNYAITEAFALDITQDKNQLFAQATGQSKFEIYPETESTFYLTVVDAQIEFVKDEKGVVTKLILHQGGQAQTGTRKR